MSILNTQVRVAIWRQTKSKCGNARYIQNTFAPPFHVHPEATFAGKSAEQPSECRLCLLLRGVKMDGFDPIAVCIICDSSDVVFRVPIAFVIALTIIIVRRKPKECGSLDSTHREMSFLVFGGKGFMLFQLLP